MVGEVAFWLLTRSQGVVFGGDSPGYLTAAQSLAHATLNPLPAYYRDMASHALYNWPPNVPIHMVKGVHAYVSGAHGPVFAQGLGIPALLAPFMAIGSVTLAMLGYFGLIAWGVVCLHQRASRLGGLGRGGRAVFALSLAAPALWLTSTQVYPDLIAGLILASVFVELALIEVERGLGRVGTAIIVVGLVVVPWLHIKNLAPLAVAMASLVIIGRRSRVASGRLVAMSTVVLASVGGLFFYNWFYFGRIGGLPLSGLSLAPETAWRSLALLMDRHQGLVVQVPTVLLGLVGLAIAGSRSWRSAVATTLGAATVLVINASYAAAPFGGSVFAGRFQWTIAPMLLAWAAVTIGRIQVHRGRLFVLGTAITALWTAQLIPILEAHHEYFNAAILPFRPWDPSLYPGWWGVLDRLLPTFVYPRGSTRDWVGGDLLALTVVIVTVLVILRLCSPRPFGLRPVGLIVAGTAVVAGVLVVASHAEPAPAVALVWTGRDLSSPWVTGERAVQYRPVPLVDVGPGSYVATFSYRSEGRAIRPPIASINLTPVPVVAVSHWLVWSDPTDARLIHISMPRPTGPFVHWPTTLRATSPGTGYGEVRFSTNGHRAAYFQISLPAGSDVTFGLLRLEKVSA